MLAVGGKPYMMSEKECPGFSHAINSDDIFFLKEQPKKMVVLGGGYIATECASFLQKLGTEVIMINRSRPLRKYDRQIGQYMLEQLEKSGIKFINEARPVRIDKESDGKLTVTYYDEELKREEKVRDVDHVLSAISRTANVEFLNTKAVPELKQEKGGKLIGGYKGEYDRLSESLYAIGDCLAGMPELTPIAIKSGRHLSDKFDAEIEGVAHRDFAVDIKNYPSTVFTWPEYSFCGLSEEEAKKRYGEDKVFAYHSRSPLLESALEEEKVKTYIKIVTVRGEDGQHQVVGLHYVGANAGEVMQGFAVR